MLSSDLPVILADESQLMIFERRRAFLTVVICVMIGGWSLLEGLRTQSFDELLSSALSLGLYAAIPIVVFFGIPLALAIRNLGRRHKMILTPAHGCIEERKGFFIAKMVNRYPLSLLDCVELKPARASSGGATITMGYYCSLRFKPDAPNSTLNLGGATDLISAMYNAIRIAGALNLSLIDHATGDAPRTLTVEEMKAMHHEGSADAPCWREPTVIGLVIVNLVFAGGILFAGWEIFPVMVLFWCEHVVIAFYVILLSLVNIPQDPGFQGRALGAKIAGAIVSVGIMAGIFALVLRWYGWFIFDMFGDEITQIGETIWSPSIFFSINSVLIVINEFHLWLGIIALLVMHGISSLKIYHRPRDKDGSVTSWAGPEYKSNLILQGFLVPGALALKYLDSPAGFLLILVLCKSIYDIKAHRRQSQMQNRGQVLQSSKP